MNRNRIPVFLLILISSSNICTGQEKKAVELKRGFQISLFPGMSTNGINSERYSNAFSLNIFSGLSSSNRAFEVGLISSSNLNASLGIQLAGLANLIGTNSYLNELKNKNDKPEKANFKGIMVSGLMNYTRNDFFGFATSAGFNLVGGNSTGVQIAGLINASGGSGKGVQIAGIFNNSLESFTGLQFASLFNNTTGPMSGIQIALVNRAGALTSNKTSRIYYGSSLQFGLFNFTGRQDGWQIGLINFSREFSGRQIGLINFFNKRAFKDERRGGTPIGLLNLGSKGSYLRIYPNELFITNFEFSTGNCTNCTLTPSGMPYHESNRKFNQNTLSLSFDAPSKLWAFGYGFQRLLYNKASMEPSDGNQRRFIGYGLKFHHYNKNYEWNKKFNLLSSLNVDIGKRIFGRSPIFIFAGISLNYLVIPKDEDVSEYRIRLRPVNGGMIKSVQSFLWPGCRIGIQLSARPESNL